MGLKLCFRKVQKYGKFPATVVILLLPLLILLSYVDLNIHSLQPEHSKYDKPGTRSPRYLINTSECKIPDLNPYNRDVLPFVKLEKYEKCTNLPLLTYIEKTDDAATLKINKSAIAMYSKLQVTCCYSKILRKNGDEEVFHSKCAPFQEEATILHQYVRVICTNIFGIVYQNVHATVIPNQKPFPKPNNVTKSGKFSVLLLAIDSMSKSNLQRTMPKTFRHLERHFVSLRGYNKVGDNTFPNLIALLAGRSMATLDPVCARNRSFDRCDLIWKRYKENGYVTAYAEDEPGLNTFNYYKEGFLRPPTDFYLRPYFIAASRLPTRTRFNMGVCTGPENSGERLLNGAKEFLTGFKRAPTFGLFWTNSFSHENINLPSSMDASFLDFFTDPDIQAALDDDSIIVFFSDHGFRFGGIRFTYAGWLEERLPFIYFKFPTKFQGIHPELYETFAFNARNRLTTPYDVHMTLQHLLKLSNRSYAVRTSPGCPGCRSLFEEIPENRTCGEAGIAQHWCTCDGYHFVETEDEDAQEVARYVVDRLNRIVRSFPQGGDLCATYQVRKIVTVGRSNRKPSRTYLILLETYPYAMFEATVRLDGTDRSFELLGDISRLNRYASYSHCANDDGLKKYCFCDGWMTKLRSGLCYLFNCAGY